MRVVVAAALVAVITVGCAGPGSGPAEPAAPGTSATTSTNAAGSTTVPGGLTAIEEPTTPLFAGERGETWARAWSELDVDALAGFFSEDALINGTVFDRALAEARVRHPDPMGWVETYEDCIHHSARFVTCDVRWTSAVHRPAGLDVPVHRAVYFDEEGLISLYRDDVRLDAVIAFEIAFATWLAEYRPDIAPVDWETEDHDRYAETVRGILGVVDEFVAWSDDYPPGAPVVEDPVLTGAVNGVEVYNANDDQLTLVAWAMARFAASGLAAPPVTHVTFPPTVACARGFSGMSYHSDTDGNIDVCTPPETFAASAGAAPLTARRTILHELAHLWTIANTDEATRTAFMDHLGLEAWTGVEWGAGGSEMAAEILMWGLMDEQVSVRVPGATCNDRMVAFAVLTGTPPPMRSCEGS